MKLALKDTALVRSLEFIFSLNKNGKLKYATIFPHEGKSIHQIVLFVCTHNINKMFRFF